MSDTNERDPADIIAALGEEARLQLLEHLAEELGYDLTESSEPVDPQTDIIAVIENAVGSLQTDLNSLKVQFGEGSELEYAELDRVADSIEQIVSELYEAHGSLHSFIDSEFDVEEEYDDEEEEETDALQ